MKKNLDIDPTEIKTDFSYDFCPVTKALTIIKGDDVIELTYWEALLLNNILIRNY
jgi:hypothetical protein